MSVDFEATNWLALAHGPIVDIMITYGVLRGVVRLLDRRGRGTSPRAFDSAEANPRDTQTLRDFLMRDVKEHGRI